MDRSSFDSRHPPPDPPSQNRQEWVVTFLVIGCVLLYTLWTMHVHSPSQNPPTARESAAGATASPQMVPLVTGEEPIIDIFTMAGCPVCHTIPGIPGATGQVGPPLILGTTGEQRLRDPNYQGDATTVHDYVVESVLEPGRFLVPGYPDRTMPRWYGSKLSALALERIAAYLERQTG